ncbi:molybdate transport system ATP-binding protein [Nakamurella panacisegetis]|uniref:Molybdate transport system ATP-binding protein n=1 Tax=Nakamurella panacisegetis TaxID=1090615 RepID=A0A1H0J5K2_9ACTN|nr:ATP-binding cassette domain-containing protein [Nakamurella panacisegetis]SDO38793.1 molybdate transport system ATP-binding protein [Nakamurella panacisegetis]
MSDLQADFALARAEFVVRVAFEVPAGESVAVLGPNGSGKSTVLGVLAGLAAPDSGQVRLGGRELTGPSTAVPAEHRRVGLMGQDPLLFPHLSALENVAFGPRSQGRTRVAARAAAGEWLDRMGLAGLESRRPAQLSGGQRQRVALARALAAEPDLLLLDEPLGALDAQTVPEIRQVLRTHLRDTGTTSILVTHDVLDAAVLADRVLVLERGRIVDDGPTGTVLTAPRSSFGATLAGLNLVPGTVSASAAEGEPVSIRTGSGLMLAGVAAAGLRAGDHAAAVFRPAAVAVFLDAPGGSPRNHWPATVRSLEPATAAVRLRTTGPADIAVDVTPAAVAELGIGPGAAVFLSIKATEVTIHSR